MQRLSGLGTDSVRKPHILVGVTSAQSCVVLPERLGALCAAGFRVSLVSAPGSFATHAAETNGVTSYAIPMGRNISPIADVVSLFRIWRLILGLKPDIVEFSTPKAGLLGSLAACLCRIPVRIYFLRGLKLESATGFKRWVLLWAERASSAFAHLTLCNSSSLRERALELQIARPSKLVLLGKGSSNGVDVMRFLPGASEARQTLGIPEKSPVIGFVGRLTSDKGIPELLEAFALILRRNPDVYLLLVGWFDAAEDALGHEVRERIEGHPRIVHTGYVRDTAPYYRTMDLLVLPSWREGFPNAVLEAAASGIPVIAATCTGSRDAVIPEVTGLLVPPGYPEAIMEATLRLLGDPALRARMSVAARQWALDHFNHARVMGLTVDFYERLFDSMATSPPVRGRSERATELPASL